MSNQTPSIGRVVHYQRYGTPGGEHKAEPSPAIITRVIDTEEGIVDAVVFNPTGQYFSQHLKYSAEPKPGHWNWPPYIPAPKPEPEQVNVREIADIIKQNALEGASYMYVAELIMRRFNQ